MKRYNIAVLAGYASTSSMLCSQLTAVLGRYMVFHPFSVDSWTGEQEMDLVLVSSHVLFVRHSPFQFHKQVDVLFIKRTLSREGWDRIRELPAGAQYLIVNDERDSVVETISLLYELGLRHVDLIPYYPGMQDARSVSRAITPGEGWLVPEGMEEAIDIGARMVDITTMVEILTRFDLLNSETRGLLDTYAKTIVTANQGLQLTMHHLIDAKNLFEETLNRVQDGVITYDEKGVIRFVNHTAEQLLGVGIWELSGRLVAEVFRKHHLDLRLLEEETKDQLATVNKQTVMVSRMSIRGQGSAAERVLILKIAEKVEELELKLRTQLRNNGHASRFSFHDIITCSDKMRRLIERAAKMANNDFSILLLGENGTGKELFAHSIHQASGRARFPFVPINCGALPENLLESELFGYEDGAFTGARKGGKPGLFEQAHRGTIFLDEIGDISPNMQIRLLRVLQQKEILKIGGTKVLPIDVRVIAATNRDLAAMVKAGTFREDLYYRLKVLQLKLLPLRERREDILLLASYFLKRRGYAQSLCAEVQEALVSYRWPGNIRELENTMEYVAIMSEGDLTADELPFMGDEEAAEEHARHHRPPPPEPPAYLSPAHSLPAACAGVELDRLLLELILEARRCSAPMGRRNMVNAARERGVLVTESEVRLAMEELRRKGLIIVRRGRAGCSLTAAGYEYMNDAIV